VRSQTGLVRIVEGVENIMSVKQKENLSVRSSNKQSITKGEGLLGRVYERLRKASLRRANRSEQALERWMDGLYWGANPADDEFQDDYFLEEHKVYLSGVLDALKAVQNGRPTVTGWLP